MRKLNKTAKMYLSKGVYIWTNGETYEMIYTHMHYVSFDKCVLLEKAFNWKVLSSKSLKLKTIEVFTILTMLYPTNSRNLELISYPL